MRFFKCTLYAFLFNMLKIQEFENWTRMLESNPFKVFNTVRYFDYSTSNGLNAIWHESSLIGTLLIRVIQEVRLFFKRRLLFPYQELHFHFLRYVLKMMLSATGCVVVVAGETMFSMLHFCVSQRQARLEERCILCASGWRERRKWGNNVVACVKYISK